MTEMAFDSKHAPGLYGRSILARISNIPGMNTVNHQESGQEGFPANGFNSATGLAMSQWTFLEEFDYMSNDFGPFAIDPIWDFSAIVPEML
jgi:hypothetical protein